MKTRYLTFCFIAIFSFSFNLAQKTKFYIRPELVGERGKEVEGAIGLFASIFYEQATDKYPCVVVTTKADAVDMLGHEKQKQLLGSSTGDNELHNSLGCDFLITLEIGILVGDKFSVTAVLIPQRTKPNIPTIRASAYCDYNENSFPQIEANLKEVSQKILNGLKKYEICPFKGEINVKITSTKKDTQKEEYSVYCNGIDGYYRKTVTIDNYSENDWTIKKVGRQTANGTVQFNLSEELTIDEINPCYECSPKKQGQRTYYEKTTTFVDIQKSSTGGDGSGIILDSARVILTFLDDGTYTVRIKAASKQGTKKTIKEVTARGICDNSNEPPKKTTNKIDEGLYELLGPFTGTAQDKVLSQKDTITKTNPASGENETITYEFNLTRE
jgi:hypothetical protein